METTLEDSLTSLAVTEYNLQLRNIYKNLWHEVLLHKKLHENSPCLSRNTISCKKIKSKFIKKLIDNMSTKLTLDVLPLEKSLVLQDIIDMFEFTLENEHQRIARLFDNIAKLKKEKSRLKYHNEVISNCKIKQYVGNDRAIMEIAKRNMLKMYREHFVIMRETIGKLFPDKKTVFMEFLEEMFKKFADSNSESYVTLKNNLDPLFETLDLQGLIAYHPFNKHKVMLCYN